MDRQDSQAEDWDEEWESTASRSVRLEGDEGPHAPTGGGLKDLGVDLDVSAHRLLQYSSIFLLNAVGLLLFRTGLNEAALRDGHRSRELE